MHPTLIKKRNGKNDKSGQKKYYGNTVLSAISKGNHLHKMSGHGCQFDLQHDDKYRLVGQISGGYESLSPRHRSLDEPVKVNLMFYDFHGKRNYTVKKNS